jgi:hypothetical protein
MAALRHLPARSWLGLLLASAALACTSTPVEFDVHKAAEGGRAGGSVAAGAGSAGTGGTDAGTAGAGGARPSQPCPPWHAALARLVGTGCRIAIDDANRKDIEDFLARIDQLGTRPFCDGENGTWFVPEYDPQNPELQWLRLCPMRCEELKGIVEYENKVSDCP